MRIIATHHCGKEDCDVFKCWDNLHDILCHSDYAERVVSIFAHKIKSEYYGRNRFISNEVISLESLSTPNHTSPLFASDSVSRQVVFHSFLYDERKQDAATTSEHSKRII